MGHSDNITLMRLGWQSVVAVLSLSAVAFGGTDPENPKTARILIHEHLNQSCELVRSGQLLQYRDYSAIVVDGIPDELYSLELTPGSFIEPASGVGIEIKSTSKAGFVVKDTGVSIPSDVPRVVAIVTGAECPALQDAVTLAAKQRGSRRESIQRKLYRPDFDNVTRPMWESPPKIRNRSLYER